MRFFSICILVLCSEVAIAQSHKEKTISVSLPQINVYENKNTLNILKWGTDSVDADISQTVIIHEQKTFEDVPAGNYSGITHIKGDEYAVVSDKTDSEGYYIFKIKFGKDGDILDIKNKGWQDLGGINMDEEAIAYNPHNNHLYIGNEEGSTIQEITLNNKTVLTKPIADYQKRGEHNRIIESLCYDPFRQHLFTINEASLKGDPFTSLRLKELNDSLQEVAEYEYLMDEPLKKDSRPVNEHAYGVSELLSLGDGTLLVLEREFYVTKLKLGSWVNNKIYRIKPGFHGKQFITSWKTSLSLGNFNLANYEGMCEGPKTKDGRHVIILCADSQNQYKGVLKDYFRTIVF
ncbi:MULTISPECIES: esterase-like activity of phytase family protein [Segatella]|jgi:hypothetical protein|uniref:Phytase-like domain-containing protein n=2 Tax=Segatella TaxID=2974251 RepID=A0AA37HVI3_SEGBR|nr:MULTISPECIES: esterase-like activity of phytase family protein [Segatella]MEE3414142.1 esterase-like activity of phytase family protein [Prevotella sp.]MDR4931755.1 esterase-like activity of phytase family protein [Segatella bryantii]OYP53225.1 hypothetical protein CIK91_13600 [Segatella bryantii]UKK75906.1 esterase-like activity of phytase family protein [Segatella bryantii]UKK77511.1 esterase-like activity of phytase family protein [Segatella baroniae B14]